MKCRSCGLLLKENHRKEGVHPATNEVLKCNYYGGYICSKKCDFEASLDIEQSMPGHNSAQYNLGCYSNSHFERNWRED